MAKPVSETKRKANKPHHRKKLINQLLILALVPSLIAFGFMVIILVREQHAMIQTRHVTHIVKYMVKTSHLIHELQKERGVSSGYIGIRGKEMAVKLNSQRHLTDQKYLALKRYLDTTDTNQYGQKCCNLLELFLKNLEDLPDIRENITSLSIPRNQSIEYFSRTIKYAIESFQQANVTIKNSPLSFPFTACIDFITAKEMAGIERAILTGFVAEDKPIFQFVTGDKHISESDMHKWMRVLKGQAALLDAFEHRVSEEILKAFHNVIMGDNTKIVEDFRKRIYMKHEEGNYGLTPSEVFAGATWRIDELKQIEDMQTNEILHSAEKYLTEKTNSFTVYIILTVVSISTIIVLSFIIARRITRPIIMLSKATKRISRGQLDRGIKIKSRNEIGELASSFDLMRKAIQEKRISLTKKNEELTSEITQRKKIEEERKVLINKLHYLNKELEDFAYIVSHDLKAPLRAIHNYADFLRKDLKGSLEEEQEMYLDGLGESVQQGELFIEDVLKLSRIGKRQLEIKSIGMETFLQDMISSLGLPSDVEIVIKEGWPAMDVEPTLLRQIFQNLITNGVKFNHSLQKTVEIGWHLLGNNHFEVFVKDNGIGIEERFLKKIFSPFQRLHTAEEYEGSGIGLAVIKKAADRLQWQVRVESKPGEGSTFFIKIPKN